jgi:LuxR family maltose regulon positive regulatory protein
LLPLAKWRMQQRLVEVTVDDLRFDDAQTDALLRAFRCAPVGEERLHALVDRAEGWVAGLQLAALAHPADVTDALSDLPTDGASVAGYLVSEVLDALPAEQRQLALAVSVLDEFDVDLAADLTGRVDAAAAVRALEDGNVFLVRTGDRRDGYRFHQLFRDLLREQLRGSDEAAWRQLHADAARLLADRGQTDAAFGHLMTIGDVDGAFDLVIRPGLLLSDLGWAREFRRWMEQLPDDLDITDPELMLDLAFANFTAGRLDIADAWIDRAEPLCAPGDPRVPMRRLAVAVAQGDRDRASAAVRAGQRATGAVAGGPFEHRFEMVVARVALLHDDLDATAAALARADVAMHDELARQVTMPAIRARLHVARGEVLEAERQATQALTEAQAAGLRTNPAILEAVVAGTAAVLGQGRTDDAAVWLDDLLDVVDAVDYPYSRAHAAALMVQLHAQQHGWAATAGRIDDLCAQAGHQSPSMLDHLLQPWRVRALAAAGRVADAEVAADVLE